MKFELVCCAYRGGVGRDNGAGKDGKGGGSGAGANGGGAGGAAVLGGGTACTQLCFFTKSFAVLPAKSYT